MSVEKYTSLITSQHNRKPDFMEVVRINTKFFVHIQNILNGFINNFDLDLAEGAQLDVIGKWVGVTRNINAPIFAVSFEWDSLDINLGWDKGIWRGNFSPAGGVFVLPDFYFRILIKARIAANYWNGSIPKAYEIWETLFENNVIIIQDNQNMTMGILFSGDSLDSLTKALVIGGYIPLKPEGVKVAYYAIPNVEGPIFSWDTIANDGLAGWDIGNWSEIINT